MAQENRKESQRLVLHTGSSRSDLASIHLYNGNSYGQDHADQYLAFLHREIQQLAFDPNLGEPIEDFEGVFVYLAVSSKRKQAHGYRIFYREHESGIEVLRVLHSRMDWRSRFE